MFKQKEDFMFQEPPSLRTELLSWRNLMRKDLSTSSSSSVPEQVASVSTCRLPTPSSSLIATGTPTRYIHHFIFIFLTCIDEVHKIGRCEGIFTAFCTYMLIIGVYLLSIFVRYKTACSLSKQVIFLYLKMFLAGGGCFLLSLCLHIFSYHKRESKHNKKRRNMVLNFTVITAPCWLWFNFLTDRIDGQSWYLTEQAELYCPTKKNSGFQKIDIFWYF